MKKESNGYFNLSCKPLSKDGHVGYVDAQKEFSDHDGCKQCLAKKIIEKNKRAKKDYKLGYLRVAYEFYQKPHECGRN